MQCFERCIPLSTFAVPPHFETVYGICLCAYGRVASSWDLGKKVKDMQELEPI